MLRQVIILLGKTPIFKREYGKALSWEALSPILNSLTDFIQQSPDDLTEFMNIVNYKVCYSTAKYYNLLVIFVTDQTDKEETIKEQTVKVRDIFVNKFSDYLLEGNYNTEIYDSIRYDTDESFRELRPKIALVGFSGVGKTTITRLIRAEEIPMKHIPTITGDVAAIKVGSLHMYLWDFAGQEQFSFIWSRFVKGSDAIILVVDSTKQNMKESKFFVDLIRKEAPKARVAIVANKQDLPGALPPEDIAKELGYRTYPLVAIDPNQRGTMLNIVAEVVEVTAGVTSLIQPMLERESLVESAEAAIMQGNLLKAAEIYRRIAELSENMGEDDMAAIFREQSKVLARQVQAAAQQVQEAKVMKPLSTEAAPRVELPTAVESQPKTESQPELVEEQPSPPVVANQAVSTTPINTAPAKVESTSSVQPAATPTSEDPDKAEIARLEQELSEINDRISELKQNAEQISPDEFEKEMVRLEDRKNQIHKQIMELRMNIIKKLAV
ncbi:MAG: ADP-ribosylation factor-like protein [Candidatus Helarchaeota archaeon]